MGKEWCLIWIMLSCMFSNAQSTSVTRPLGDELSFHLLDVESGLSHNYINSIETDALGFVWIATIDGLNRYDGSKFLHFKKEFEKPAGTLLNNHVEDLTIDEKGNLVIATDGGLSKYDPIAETIVPFLDDNSLSDAPVNVVINGPNGDIILGLIRHSRGIRLIHSDGTMDVFAKDDTDKHSLSSNNVSCLAMQGDSILWAGTPNRGLNKINYRTKQVTRVWLEGEHDTAPYINTVYTDIDGNIWIGTDKGLKVITSKGDTLALDSSLGLGKGLSGDNVLAFEEDHQGQLWVGTRNNGLNIFNREAFLNGNPNFRVKWYLPKSDGTSVFNRTVSCIKMDSFGNMWLGTSTGLNFVNPKGEPVVLMKKNVGEPNSLSHNRIGSLELSSDGKIWIGTDGGGLDMYDISTGEFSNFHNIPSREGSLSNNYVISLLEDTKSRLWAGTYQGGLNRLDAGDAHFRQYLQGTQEQGSDVRVIFEDKDGQIWVGTNRGGLYSYNELKDLFVFVPKFGKIDIRDIEQDKDGKLWFATFGDGLISYDPTSESTTYYNTSNTPGIPTNVMFCLKPLQDGSIVAGTRYGGLLHFDPNSGNILTYTEKNGLSNNTVNSIALDGDHRMWLGTFNGISYYDPDSRTIGNVTGFSNIQKGEFNIGASLFYGDNLLFIGGNKGLNVLDLKKLNQSKQDHKLVLTDVEVFNEPMQISKQKKAGYLDQSITHTDELVLRYDQTLFAINFTVLKYPRSSNTFYSYALEGYNDNWVDLGQNGKATLTNIPPGDYVLKIKATINPGAEITKSLPLTITPPFWKTLPAYLIYVVVTLGLVFGFMKYYSERIKLRNSLLFEKKQRLLEQDLNEERIRFFTNFSHELKTPLTLILAPLDDLVGLIRDKKQLESLRLVQKNAKYLYHTINKLLEFRKSESGLGELYIGKYSPSDHLKKLMDNYSPLAKKMKVEFGLSVPKENITSWFDLEKFQLIINNLLSNAFKHVDGNGKIKVSLTYDANDFFVCVKNSGKGIPKKELHRIFKWYYQAGDTLKRNGSGIGLAITKNFVELHGGNIEVESEIGSWAKFVVRIPRKKEHFLNFKDVQAYDQREKEEMSAGNLWGPSQIGSQLEETFANIELSQQREVLLLIDDNPDILQYLSGLLEDEYDLIYAENGEKGVEKAFNYVPDLIVSDIMMPQKSGMDLCALLKRNVSTTHIPIILLSAKDNHESIQMGFEEGADDYIIKPFNGNILKARIKNLLLSRKSLRNYFSGEQHDLPQGFEEKGSLLAREKKFLLKLDDIILEHLEKDSADVNNIAKQIGMSRSSLFRKLKAITGHNINDRIRSIKIKRAASLIRDEGVSVSQAAYAIGFSSVKHFRKLFKEQLGTLPSEYQKRNHVDKS